MIITILKLFMTTLKYIIAIMLTLGWVVGYYVFDTGKEIHLLLGMAVMTTSVIIIKQPRNEIKTLI